MKKIMMGLLAMITSLTNTKRAGAYKTRRHYKTITLTCPRCGKDNISGKKYCSLTCGREARQEKLNRIQARKEARKIK